VAARDFIVGNPPFIGNKRMRDALGHGYVDTLREAWPDVPESADFVMYWWHHAASLVRAGEVERFGLITTNSLRQSFNRKIVEHHLSEAPALSLRFAIPDHPWVDRCPLEAPSARSHACNASYPKREVPGMRWQSRWKQTEGEIHADLKIGANVSSAVALRANSGLSHMGVIVVGAGFVVEHDDELLKLEPGPIKRYMNGRDLTQVSRGVSIIDFAGLSESEARARFPNCYQRVVDRVKPERAVSNDKYLRENWWLFRRTNRQLRVGLAGLPRYIGTTETAKHRVFSFIDGGVLPDQKIRVVTADDALTLGVLSSALHVAWALATGGRLGVGNDPVYNNTRCFEPFPFPHDDTGLAADLATRIRALAEQMDAHRKAQQAAHPELTLTGMYNVLEKLRRAEPLNAKDKLIHSQGLVSVLKSLHDELDAAVLAAYGWSDLQVALATHTQPEARAAAVETLLERLVALNARRAAEEAAGTVRWLRPSFQCRTASSHAALEGMAEAEDTPLPAAAAAPAVPAVKAPWPVGLPEQIKAVSDVLASADRPLGLEDLAAHFAARGRWRDRLPTILGTLEAVGRARKLQDGRWQTA
jgi:hypothetical protein